ncbi:MAG: cytochrome P450 [Halioglobus sp.]
MGQLSSDPDNSSFKLDPFAAEFASDPYPTYRLMRENHPVYYHEAWDMWLFSSFADVFALATDKRLVRTLEHVMSAQDVATKRAAENWAATPVFSRYVRVNVIDSEGEMHDRLRGLVSKTFTSARISALREQIQQLVDARIKVIRDMAEFDFIEDFVAPIPGLIIGQLLGVQEQDCDRLRIWSENIVQFFEQDRTPEDLALAEEAATEFSDYLLELAAQRRAVPRDDLISLLVAAETQGELNRDELISTCIIILAAGHGSTIDVSGNGMLALLRNPQEMDRLRAEPEHIHTAVQEMFRYESPLPFFHRFMLEDMEFRGQQFPKGTKIGLMYGAANRDPHQFDDPERFDITRSPNRHIAFGKGAHFCLGNHLARLDMEIIFTTLLREFSSIECFTSVRPEYRLGITSRGLKSLPLTVS